LRNKHQFLLLLSIIS